MDRHALRDARCGLALTALSLLVGCGASSLHATPNLPAGETLHDRTGTRAATQPIQHIVIVVQENRSFENFFAGFPGADAPMVGRMKTAAGEQNVHLHEIRLKDAPGDLPHNASTGLDEWDGGKMDGFGLEMHGSQLTPTTPYAWVRHSDIAPYWTMAQRYVLADHMFPTEFGASFTGHLELIAGTTNLTATEAEVDGPSTRPWGCDALPGTTTGVWTKRRRWEQGPFPCFTQFRTLADTLDASSVAWKYYVPSVGVNGGDIWSEFDAIKSVRYGPDWRNVVTPETAIFSDISARSLPAVSWVMPDFAWSDHPGAGNDTGPSWVAAIVNAIGKSSYWRSTAIIVVWDDWGGWYDNVAPPQLDFRGLSIRVPCLIISPYAKPHHISHTRYEFGSVLKFVEQTFGLKPLQALPSPYGYGYTDERANSLADSFDFTQAPHPFVVVPAPYPLSHFLHAKPSFQPLDNE